jgi:predicted RNase H-like nuclease (RuvC/YqgF family)
LDRLHEQRRRLESAISLIRTQRDLCIEKALRCEGEAEKTIKNEQEQDRELHRCLDRLNRTVEDKKSTITTLEVEIIRQEKEAQLLASCQKVQVDLNGLALRVTRLTRSVRQDEKAVEAEKTELLERCEVRTR